MNTTHRLTATLLLMGTVHAADAAVVRVEAANFVSGAGLITFSENAGGTQDPTYNPADYGGGADSPTVTFGGWFEGQGQSANAATDCPGAAASACVVGNPTASLSLDPAAFPTFITIDGSAPNSPVLSGTPQFNGPIAFLFDMDQFGVGFDGGFFNAAGSTAITAFNRAGALIGSVANTGLGIEFLGLVSDQADIAGVFLDLVGAETDGFAIDSIRFGKRGEVVVPPADGAIPIPAGFPLLAGGLALFGLVRRRRG